jgi:hypothetical protein
LSTLERENVVTTFLRCADWWDPDEIVEFFGTIADSTAPSNEDAEGVHLLSDRDGRQPGLIARQFERLTVSAVKLAHVVDSSFVSPFDELFQSVALILDGLF